MPTADIDIYWRRNQDRMTTPIELWAVILLAISIISFFAYRLIKRVPVVKSSHELIKEAIADIGGTVSVDDVTNWIFERHPYQFEKDMINSAIKDLSVNGPSSSDYREEQKFLFRIDNKNYRFYDPEKDGLWKMGRRLDEEKTGFDAVKSDIKTNTRHKFITKRETITTKERKIPVFISKALPSKCPSCSSPFNGKSGDACEYCGSIIREEEKIRKAE